MTTDTFPIKRRLSVHRRAYLALAFGVFCVAWGATLIKIANVPGPASAFYRLLVASCVLLPWQARYLPFRSQSKLILWTALAGVLFAVNAVLWNTSLLLTSAANSTVLANTAPLWVGLGTLVFFGQRLPRGFWTGLVVAFCGVVLLVGRDMLLHPSFGLGDLLAMGAAFLYSGSLLIIQRVRQSLNAFAVTTLMAAVGAVIVFGMCLAFGTPLTGYSLRTWLALLTLGVVSHVGGIVSVNYAIAHIGAAITSVTMLGQAALSATVALLVLGETLAPLQILGGALVLGGVYLVHRR